MRHANFIGRRLAEWLKARKFVQVYAQREIECTGALFSQPDSSALEQGIAFNFNGQTTLNRPDGRSRVAPKAYIFGGLTPPCGSRSFSGHVRSFAVFLKPLSFWPLFRIPSSVLMTKEYDAEDFLEPGDSGPLVEAGRVQDFPGAHLRSRGLSNARRFSCRRAHSDCKNRASHA
jgi:hypothetical protein